MDKINFQNKKLPAVNATNLNQLQTNVETAINQVNQIKNGNITAKDGITIQYPSIVQSGKVVSIRFKANRASGFSSGDQIILGQITGIDFPKTGFITMQAVGGEWSLKNTIYGYMGANGEVSVNSDSSIHSSYTYCHIEIMYVAD